MPRGRIVVLNGHSVVLKGSKISRDYNFVTSVSKHFLKLKGGTFTVIYMKKWRVCVRFRADEVVAEVSVGGQGCWWWG